MKFKAASEPTDIIWENRHYTADDYKLREVKAWSIIGTLLLISFAIIYRVARTSTEIAREFPSFNCDSINEIYGDQIQRYAIQDHNFVNEYSGLPSSGALKCFCDAEIEKDKEFALKSTYGHPDNVAICADYKFWILEAFVWMTSLKYFITIFNFVLRTVVISAIAWIGYPTETRQLEETTKVTFYVQFFNTAFLLLLVNADMSEQIFSFGLYGIESDFDKTWFKMTGNIIVGTMIFILLWPIIEAFMFFGLRMVGRIMDRGFSNDPYKTKVTSIQGYVDMYSGPGYLMHYKYSALLTIIFVTMTFGFGIPILFPIAAIAILILYIVEKSMLYYAYKLPPMYDERLSQSVIKTLYWAPIFYLSFGFWMASNKQMLSNDNLETRERMVSPDVSDHTIDGFLMGDCFQSPAWPLALLCGILILNQIFGDSINHCLQKYFPNLIIGDVVIDEDIDNYFMALDEKDRAWATEENKYATEKLGIQLFTQGQREALETSLQTDHKPLQGCHSYDILANPLYFDDFQYVSASTPNRENYIIDDDVNENNDAIQSDLVRLSLNLAYMNESEAHEFKFNQAETSNKILRV